MAVGRIRWTEAGPADPAEGERASDGLRCEISVWGNWRARMPVPTLSQRTSEPDLNPNFQERE